MIRGGARAKNKEGLEVGRFLEEGGEWRSLEIRVFQIICLCGCRSCHKLWDFENGVCHLFGHWERLSSLYQVICPKTVRLTSMSEEEIRGGRCEEFINSEEPVFTSSSSRQGEETENSSWVGWETDQTRTEPRAEQGDGRVLGKEVANRNSATGEF